MIHEWWNKMVLQKAHHKKLHAPRWKPAMKDLSCKSSILLLYIRNWKSLWTCPSKFILFITKGTIMEQINIEILENS